MMTTCQTTRWGPGDTTPLSDGQPDEQGPPVRIREQGRVATLGEWEGGISRFTSWQTGTACDAVVPDLPFLRSLPPGPVRPAGREAVQAGHQVH